MMPKSLYILLVLTNLYLFTSAQPVPLPNAFSIVDTIQGDLDNDSIMELLVIYNTDRIDELDGVERELTIYKIVNKKWEAWITSKQAILGSKDGGMMGDPYGSMEIKNGVLSITHSGGSSWKWGVTDKYRYQNGSIYLIGFTSSYGKPCEYWEVVDFTISTGKLLVEKETEQCISDDVIKTKKIKESMFYKNLKITIDKRQEREIIIKTPKYNFEIYLANGPD